MSQAMSRDMWDAWMDRAPTQALVCWGMVPPDQAFVPGARLGDYELIALLGRGGMGEVWEARRRTDGQRCALKMVLGSAEQHGSRLTREAAIIAEVRSRHIPDVFETGSTPDGTEFIAMELLEGETLTKLIARESPMPVADAVDLLLQIVEGVAEAHALGVVHRDLKPSNVFVQRTGDGGPRVAKVLDFGLAKRMPKLNGDDPTSLTATGATLGTPGYISPEQLRDTKRADHRTDIWAIGLILYKMLTGHSAFPASDAGEYYAMILTEAPTALRAERADAPSDLEDIILRCLERDPARRYPSLSSLAVALRPLGTSASEANIDRIIHLTASMAAAFEPAAGRTVLDDETASLTSPTVVREVVVKHAAPSKFPRWLPLAGLVVGGAAALVFAAPPREATTPSAPSARPSAGGTSSSPPPSDVTPLEPVAEASPPASAEPPEQRRPTGRPASPSLAAPPPPRSSPTPAPSVVAPAASAPAAPPAPPPKSRFGPIEESL